jgi:hypothetical protein
MALWAGLAAAVAVAARRNGWPPECPLAAPTREALGPNAAGIWAILFPELLLPGLRSGRDPPHF